ENINTFFEGFNDPEFNPSPTRFTAALAADISNKVAAHAHQEEDYSTAAIGASYAAEFVSIALDFTPGIGSAKAFVEAVTGYNVITGHELSSVERALSAASIIPFGAVLKAARLAGQGIKISLRTFLNESVQAFAREGDDL